MTKSGMLQWGRGFKTPEISTENPVIHAAIKLQWGRGFKTPEIWPAGKSYTRAYRFNGAGVLRPRKSGKE